MTTTGDLLRTEGQAQATAAADPRTVLHIDSLIARANYSGERWSCNDIRDLLPVCDQHLVGARVDAARKRGEMVAVGWTKSSLPSTRSKPVTVWQGKPDTGNAALPLLALVAFFLAVVGFAAHVLSSLAAVGGWL